MSTRRMSMCALVAATCAMFAPPALAQTIEGTLMEVESERPISLGLVIMLTEEGDSVTSAVTDANGRFHLEADAPGSFLLVASAFGFKETPAGVFELGPGGEMDVEFRIAAEAMPIEGLLVSLQRPAITHQLITNGYVRRLQRGLGHFITPYDIEQSSATRTADLFRGIPGVAVNTPGGGLNAFTGESVRFYDARGVCTPTVYVDGSRQPPTFTANASIDMIVPLQDLEAVEVYRRPSEIPVEYGALGTNTGADVVCGVLLLWTKHR
jgi:hypothetical protein